MKREAPDLVDDVSVDALHDEGVGEVRGQRRLLVAAAVNRVLHRLVLQHRGTLVLRALQHLARVFLQQKPPIIAHSHVCTGILRKERQMLVELSRPPPTSPTFTWFSATPAVATRAVGFL